MSTIYHWKTPEDAAFLFLILGIFGLVQIPLSYAAAYVLSIASPIVLTLVPLGVVLVQATGTALLAEAIASRRLQLPRHPSPARPTPLRQYLNRLAVFLASALIILSIWALIYTIWFTLIPPNQPAHLVKYILAQNTGALTSLLTAVILEWLLKR